MQQTARAAVLTAPKTFEIREYPIPAFGLCPVVLGHEGTGEIVAMGRNITKDTAGNPVALGDKIVTCIIPCGTCDACLNTPARTNLCENVGVYGLMPDDDVHLNGYFGEYLVIRKGSTFFNVSGMTLDQRILVEPAAVVAPSAFFKSPRCARWALKPSSLWTAMTPAWNWPGKWEPPARIISPGTRI